MSPSQIVLYSNVSIEKISNRTFNFEILSDTVFLFALWCFFELPSVADMFHFTTYFFNQS